MPPAYCLVVAPPPQSLNAGKSTLMNLLTQAGVLAEDRLFATLDPTARALKLPGENGHAH